MKIKASSTFYLSHKLLLISFCFSFQYTLPQTNKTDSLWAVFKNSSQADTNRLWAISSMAQSYSYSNPDTSIILAKKMLYFINTMTANKRLKEFVVSAYEIIGSAKQNKGLNDEAINSYMQALKISEELRDKKLMGICFTNIGIIYKKQSNFPKAKEYYSRDLKICEELSDKKGVGICYNNIARVYDEESNYPKALEYYLNSLKIAIQTKNKESEGIVYLNIGGLYISMFNYTKAIEYFLKSSKIGKEIGNKQLTLYSLGNIGRVYDKQKNYDKALTYYLSTLKISEELDDKYSIGHCNNHIGVIYTSQFKYDKALVCLLKSLEVRKEMGEKSGVAITFNNLTDLFIQNENYKKALFYSDSAIQLSTKIKDMEIERQAYKNLSEISKKTGQYKKAFESYVKFKTLTDSIFNENNSKQLGELKTKYEVDKKESELKAMAEAQEIISTEEKKRQQFLIYSVAGVLVIVIFFSALLYKRFILTNRQKQIIEAKEKETQQQNEIIRVQKHLVEEKHKEITDSINYAERIQRSFLATQDLLDQNLRQYFVFFQPKDVVSGDFYWAAKLRNENFILVTADSTGHGVPGAIMSILNISCLENSIKDGLVEPSEIFNNTRKNIIERLKKDGSTEGGKDGMDACLISFDFKNNRLTYSAANNPLWIVRENKIIELACDKMPVGKHDMDSISFNQHIINLEIGDVVYSFTDGLPDQFGGPKGKKFMYKQLKELLISISLFPMNEQKDVLQNTLNNWKGDLEQVDDICLVGVRV